VFGLNSAWIRKIKRRALRRADATTVVGEAMKDRVIALGAAADRVTTQPMGVDLSERFTPPQAPRSRAKILFVGRLVDIKGVNHLIDAMAAVREQCPAAELIIAGFGPEEARLRRQVESMGLSRYVTFAGPVAQEDLPAMYREAAVFVAPFVSGSGGEQEGFGIVVVEAIGCGCPVVASAIPAFVSLFADHTDMLVEPGNVDALAQKIVSVLRNPDAAQTTVLTMRQRLRSRLDWSVVASDYADTLLKTLRAP
jgi:glycosyltransferase involved in cell wall biosynthesis